MMKLRGQTNWDRVMLYNCVHHLLAGILNLIISLHTRNENHNLPRLERRSNLPTTHPDYLVWEIRGNFQKKFTVAPAEVVHIEIVKATAFECLDLTHKPLTR